MRSSFSSARASPPRRSARCATSASCEAAVREVALPALLKTSRLGYDGKGQAPVDRPEDAPAAFRALGSVPCVLERRLALETEVSVVLARGDRWRGGRLPRRGEPAPERDSRDHGRTGAGGPRHAGRGAEHRVPGGHRPGLRGRAGGGDVRRERRSDLRQRAGAPSTQQRPLHARRLLRGPVRAAAPRPLRLFRSPSRGC